MKFLIGVGVYVDAPGMATVVFAGRSDAAKSLGIGWANHSDLAQMSLLTSSQPPRLLAELNSLVNLQRNGPCKPLSSAEAAEWVPVKKRARTGNGKGDRNSPRTLTYPAPDTHTTEASVLFPAG
jgi:hypothetical protein